MKRKTLFITSLITFILAILVLIAYLLYPYIRPQKSPVNDIVPQSSEIPHTEPDAEPVDNPIDFTAYKERNPDVIGWISIPGTKVDYPILQSGEDLPESYYLNHNIDRDYEYAGSIYIQRYNLADFSDPNTIIYGHNMKNGSMFASIHKFKDKTFFEENKYIYIYLPGHILTYEIFAAYRYDNRHLLYYFDFNDKEIYAEYLNMAKNPTDSIRNVREETEVTTDDRIITLSTCITNDNYRYLVQGVLIDDRPTK